MDQSRLAETLLETFVQRRDVYAVQDRNGAYRPIYQELTTHVVERHLAGEITVGHYMPDEQALTRIICFDVDLEVDGVWMQYPDFAQLPEGLTRDGEDAWTGKSTVVHPSRPREDWRDRAHPGRGWYKQLLRTFGDALSWAMSSELGIRTLLSYSGSKGVHAYGLTGPIPASEARAGAQIALAAAGGVIGGMFAPARGSNFYKISGGAPWATSVAVETFPKQDSLEGKKLGNLLRLPLGTNQKSPDPCFFVDQTKAQTHLEPVTDPLSVLLARSAY